MDSKHSEILGEIIRDLGGLAELLREKRWPEIVEYLERVRVTVKGIPRDAAYLGKFLIMWTAGIQAPEIVVDELLDIQVEADHMEALAGKCPCQRQTDIAQPDDADAGLLGIDPILQIGQGRNHVAVASRTWSACVNIKKPGRAHW